MESVRSEERSGFPKEPPFVALAQRNTPVIPLPRWNSKISTNVQVFLKRDDNNSCTLAGNKVRKMEYILADALQKGSTSTLYFHSLLLKEVEVLISVGSFQSNHARTVAIIAASRGLKCYLLLRTKDGQPPEDQPNGNYFLSMMTGAKVKYCTPAEYKMKESILEEMANQMRAEGEVPYVIPEGGSFALGLWGYINAMKEIADSKENYTHIVCAVGSGGTLDTITGGVLLGKELFGMKDTRVIGIPICDSSQFFRDTVTKLVKEFNDQFHCEVSISEYDMWDEFIGPGSGIPYKEQIECMKSLAREEGIFLDPVYTGKAFYGLEQKIKDGYFKEGSKILFIHSGGIFGLLAQHTSFYPM